MNRKEVLALMTTVKIGYPEYYRNQSDVNDAALLWGDVLADENPVLIGKALKEFIRTDTRGFPPKAGQLIGIAKDLRIAELREEELARAKLPEPETAGIPMPDELREKFNAMLERMKV